MRIFSLFAGLLAGILPLRADPPAAPPVLPPPPAALSGYELRALDLRKHIRFQVGGSQVEVAVPLFAYCPAAGGVPVLRLLRAAQAALMGLARKPEWTADELHQVISDLDRAALLLEAPPPPGQPVLADRD